MGQGALTGLCQLVAEELECDWSKVTWEYVDPRENIRRKRIYGDFNSTGSNAIRQSHDYVRRGGAAARQMLIQAAANEWKVPASECTAANSVITHTPSGRKTSYGKVVQRGRQDRAAGSEEPHAQGPEGLEDRRQADQAARHHGQAHRQAEVLGRHPAARHAQRRDQGLPGARRQGRELRRRQGQRHEGREERPRGRRQRGRGGRRHLVARQDRARCAAGGLGRRPRRQGLERHDRGVRSKEGLEAETPFVGNRTGDINAALAGAAKKVEAVYAYPYQNHACMEPLNATARYTADKCEVWTSTQNAEAVLAAAVEASGLPFDKVRGHRGLGRRRLRPARAHRLRHAGGADRQADARHADQAPVVARRGHDPGHLPSDHDVQAHRGARQGQQRDRAAHAHLRPVDPRRHRAGPARQRPRSRDLPGTERRAAPKARSATTSRTS